MTNSTALAAVIGPDAPLCPEYLTDQELAQFAETARGAERESVGVARALDAEAARRAAKDGAA